MSRLGKGLFLLAGLSIVVLVATRYLLGGWIDYLYIPLGLFAVSLVAAIVVDFKFYLEFLTLRTTKHGMNMGVMILLAIVVLVSLNYISVRYDESVDVTENKLNSLAPQSQDLLEGLKEEITFKVFYKGQEASQDKQRVKQQLSMYEDESSKVEVRFYNLYVENLLAQEYVNALPDKNRSAIFVFAERGRKKVRVDAPFTEQEITSALVKVTRDSSKKVYFVTGHGERPLDEEGPDGLQAFKQSLEDSSYQVAELNLLESPKIPEDADVVAIVGPRLQYMDAELDVLRKYARSGGRILLAIDPGEKHGLARLAKSLGAEFKNNYIINEVSQLVGRGMATALGFIYNDKSEITKRFKDGQGFTAFDQASEVVTAPSLPEDLEALELVKTHNSSFTINSLQEQEGGERKSHSVMVSVKGKLQSEGSSKEGGSEEAKDFAAVVVGDSDFLSNQSLPQGFNRDLALNTMAHLAQQSDLISIRPKRPEGTELTMTRTTQVAVVIAGISAPLMLLVLSGVVWFRRRGA